MQALENQKQTSSKESSKTKCVWLFNLPGIWSYIGQLPFMSDGSGGWSFPLERIGIGAFTNVPVVVFTLSPIDFDGVEPLLAQQNSDTNSLTRPQTIVEVATSPPTLEQRRTKKCKIPSLKQKQSNLSIVDVFVFYLSFVTSTFRAEMSYLK